ncbi:helix-turn-helix domain-containing protein [Candidatus Berkiella aquae]|uniref:MarR family transcriptional regulator n=1 Tax=Candidatus Berkiella aquae TaxID=295108 RepID=A0A0Q9YLB3_9GAMM|nr:helix-turn-helix domain-containing protein [Candidatus Berkiella aquae]MCS5711463.1 MarR family transcriptional regulator [Candidatus Berkiella aquae]
MKPQDCLILLKLLANPKVVWTQRELSSLIFISLAEVNQSIKRLIAARLIRKDNNWLADSFKVKNIDIEQYVKFDSILNEMCSKNYINDSFTDKVKLKNIIIKNINLPNFTNTNYDNLFTKNQIAPIKSAAKEFLIYGLKYVFPAELGEYTRGVPTAIGAPFLSEKFVMGDDPIPVWPSAEGEVKGVALEPIHPSVTKSLQAYPDDNFYKLLVLVDTIRVGRARERNMSIEMLEDVLNDENE